MIDSDMRKPPGCGQRANTVGRIKRRCDGGADRQRVSARGAPELDALSEILGLAIGYST